MNKIKFAYYLLLLVSAVELGRGLQMIFNPLFWDPLYSNIRLTSGLQVFISALLFIIARILKPTPNGDTISYPDPYSKDREI